MKTFEAARIQTAARAIGVVDAPPAEYALGKRVRFHQNIRATGRLPEKRVLRLETRPADPGEAAAIIAGFGIFVLIWGARKIKGALSSGG